MIDRSGTIRYLDKFNQQERERLQTVLHAVFQLLYAKPGTKKAAEAVLKKAYDKILDIPI